MSAAISLAAPIRLLTVDEMHAKTERPECLPACRCLPSTTWASRRYDGTWDDGFESDEGLALESRTCTACGATHSREVPA